uniref:Uncharacterized protein n=1 Tax=Pithovirus LCPAC101 TaxID=2506586 RepID=A0A481Z452_9VIRU|nr:MAG: hypothetical protein LCPAC101_00520 [Pithovirus LCPAC101]
MNAILELVISTFSMTQKSEEHMIHLKHFIQNDDLKSEEKLDRVKKTILTFSFKSQSDSSYVNTVMYAKNIKEATTKAHLELLKLILEYLDDYANFLHELEVIIYDKEGSDDEKIEKITHSLNMTNIGTDLKGYLISVINHK